MAILIPMIRVSDDDIAAVYDATTSRGRVRLRITKRDGAVEVLDAESDREAITDFTVTRVSKVLSQLQERGEYPEETDYRH